MARFKLKEKLAHYRAIVKGEKAVKSDSKFSPSEQISYACGQRDARNELNAIYKKKNATPLERKAYASKREVARLEYFNHESIE